MGCFSSNSAKITSSRLDSLDPDLKRKFLSGTFNYDSKTLRNLNFLNDLILGDDVKLNVLSAKNNDIEELPEIFVSSLTELKNVLLSSNRFNKFPRILIESKSSSSIKQIDLSSNLINEIPQAISSCTNLQILKASANKLRRIIPELSSLSKLKELDLSFNQIDTLPQHFASCSAERVLLNNNQIAEIEISSSSTWSSSGLISLDLSYNKLKNIEANLLKHSKLSILNLKGNEMDFQSFKRMEGFDEFMERRKKIKDQGFTHNLDVEFDVCGLQISK